ncbi:propionate kinase [Yersinia nurmii]|uniref:Propionate kinase n=1 Tax=Yersinia nurmii TaxID=685706 RepID=A0AAW7JYY6_9GAMM|nr:propionate kinase [Yersinia nurmii]MDN0087799.1 propionate kinase [Yersinia nurmii]CNE75727.1 propionate/acetate kinase [Yersinia nurmii]
MTLNPTVLVINSGSSSIKFSVLNLSNCEAITSGIADGIGSETSFLRIDKNAKIQLGKGSYADALTAISDELAKCGLDKSITLIGHRVAHGGEIFSESVLINDRVVDEIKKVSPLAPLHNYANLHGIEAARQLFPGIRQVAVFDTGFHQTLKPEAYIYALPYRYFREQGVRRYGFHGTSYRYVASKAVDILGFDEQDYGLIIAHLGNGASICAIQDGKSVDTSMGMTPLEGLVMGTRSGDMDFGALAYLAHRTGQNLEDLDHVLNKESGLLGISGLSGDMRVLEKAYREGHAGARLAINVFVHRLAKHIGGHASSLRRFDALILTGGIGENSALIRQLTLEHLGVFGFEIDSGKNAQLQCGVTQVITTKASKVIAAVIPTNEEKMIALDAIRLGYAQCGAAVPEAAF